MGGADRRGRVVGTDAAEVSEVVRGGKAGQ